MDAFVIPGVPLHCDVEGHSLCFIFIFELADLREKGFLRCVEVFNKVDEAAFVLVENFLLTLSAFIFELDGEAFI